MNERTKEKGTSKQPGRVSGVDGWVIRLRTSGGEKGRRGGGAREGSGKTFDVV